MVEAWQNPYSPGMAAVPPVLTGRDEWLARFDGYLKGLRGGYPVEHLCFSGPRGMGKTVLLERFGEMAGAHQVPARRVEATGDSTFPGVLAAALGEIGEDLVSRGAGLRRVRAAVEEVTVTVGGGPVKAEVRARRPAPLDPGVHPGVERNGQRVAGGRLELPDHLVGRLGLLRRLGVEADCLVEEALTQAEQGELGPFHRLLDAVSRPFDQRPGLEDLTGPAPAGSAHRFD